MLLHTSICACPGHFDFQHGVCVCHTIVDQTKSSGKGVLHSQKITVFLNRHMCFCHLFTMCLDEHAELYTLSTP